MVHEIGAVVEQCAVTDLRGRVQDVAVAGARHGGLQQLGGVDSHRAFQRLQPSTGRELGSPDEIDDRDVIPGVAGLEVLHQVFVLLVGFVGLFLEDHRLAGVRRVPFVDEGPDDVRIVLALHIRDGSASVQVVVFGLCGSPDSLIRTGRRGQYDPGGEQCDRATSHRSCSGSVSHTAVSAGSTPPVTPGPEARTLRMPAGSSVSVAPVFTQH